MRSLTAVGDFARHAIIIVEVSGLVQRLDAKRALSLALTYTVYAKITGDLIEPGEHLRFATKAIVMLEGADEGFLGKVGRLFIVSDKPVYGVEDLLLILGNQSIKVRIPVRFVRRL